MNKSLIAVFAALIAAVTAFASTAEAGLKIRLGFGGPLPAFTAHGPGHGSYAKRNYHRKRYIARRAAKQKAVAAKKTAAPKVAKSTKKVAKPRAVAKAPAPVETAEETAEEVEVIADSENSSITTAAVVPVETDQPAEAAPVKVKAEAPSSQPKGEPKRTSKLDCKKFFPSVGMTLTVPCE